LLYHPLIILHLLNYIKGSAYSHTRHKSLLTVAGWAKAEVLSQLAIFLVLKIDSAALLRSSLPAAGLRYRTILHLQISILNATPDKL